MYQAGLVLEGGGMKGVYTAGVLDFFLDKGILFSSVYGVSAGACHMGSYLSGQRGRALAVNIDYLDRRNYCSLESLLRTGDLFNVEMCYHRIPEELNPYDYEAFNRYTGKAFSVATNIETGKAEYFRIRDMKKDIDKIRASTRLGLIRARYRRYPKVYELMKERHINYNGQLDFIRRQQENGQAFVIRPQEPSDVGRVEKDVKKLKGLYRQGYEQAAACYEELLAYLEA